ncbi:acetyl-CoA synthetase-like protein [Hesseltinella vesiculosa]|uniref:Very long-chain fatty acid transport protein n=1 Tax=Hesseltinella vesiculosa TaxID=101127 RepID=A0A1X2GR48_9FUNG|nr:acetyl-CoA synthetase-like protein [Hesseltinella vesiculosa]
MSGSLLPVAAAGIGGFIGSMYVDSRLLLSRDAHQLKAGVLAKIYHRIWEYKDKLHYYYRFKDRAATTPEGVFLVFEGKEYTYRHIEQASNRLAHWLLAQNVKRNEIVCMMLQNHPTFFISLFAISKIGAVPSLINNNLSDDSLLHCINVAEAKLFLFDPTYEKSVATVVNRTENVRFFAFGEACEYADITSDLAPALGPSVLNTFSDKNTDEALIKGVGNSDPAFLIYTSGTTGMPKAAISQHSRVAFGMNMFARVSGITQDDRVYCVLPIYHSSGLIVCCSTAMMAGATIVLGRRFSARRFWNDCVDYDVTVFTYIGEFCRYLLSQPTHPEERNHKVRMVYGNGMRPDVWNRFRDRFGIPTIFEFYAATEAPTSLFNVNTGNFGAGAVGHRGYLFRALRSEVQMIKIDPVSEEPLRTKAGLCVPCSYGEQGELLARMDPNDALQFDGYYKNKSATDKKILRDVFVKGDAYFRSGDLLKLDQDGFYYFGDRVGDTFRWKSENVATTEVAQALGVYPGVAEANIYGALVPHHDGRAGMAALVRAANAAIDFKDLYQYLKRKLPKYAIPVFVRFVPAMELTGTFKQQKVHFRNEGIDMEKIQDEIFWLQGETYVPFSKEDYQRIVEGKVKL